MFKKGLPIFLSIGIMISMAACSQTSTVSSGAAETEIVSSMQTEETAADTQTETLPETLAFTETETETSAASKDEKITEVTSVSGGALETGDMFTERDLTQTADLSEAEEITVESNTTIDINSAGTYLISGSGENVTISVDAGDEDKVQIVLDGVKITNDDQPVIYVKNADKVFVTTTQSENVLAVTGAFTADGDTNTDAVIFSKDDLVINGLGTLQISSTDNGISCKDDLKITGGTLTVICTGDALEANESIAIADGQITITTDKDAIHAENDEDDSTGFVYICGGKISINAADDAIQAAAIVQIDGGNLALTGAECIEGTWVQINDGTIDISASDDGINGAQKSSAYTPTVEINGGDITIAMGQGDTDAVDANGNLSVTGGNIDITGQSSFDVDGNISYTGGTITVNGTQIDQISNQMMGGGMGGQGMPGGMNGQGMPGGHGGMGGHGGF